MAATTGRKSFSIHDYPEHLNPFHEEDNHNKIRFWTIGRKLNRTNSINFSGIKDLRNSWSDSDYSVHARMPSPEPKKTSKNIKKRKSPSTSRSDFDLTNQQNRTPSPSPSRCAPKKKPSNKAGTTKTKKSNTRSLRSFMRKDKKKQSQDNKLNQVNGDNSPIVYRRALQCTQCSHTTTTNSINPKIYGDTSASSGVRSTVGSPEHADRYVYGGSITPLPRSRFQERLRSTSNYEVNSVSTTPRMARSEVSGSQLSVESTNPFDEAPVPPVRASRRKKKRAPMPPQGDTSVSSINTILNISEVEDKTPDDEKKNNPDLESEDVNLNVELKIVEDEEAKPKEKEAEKPPDVVQDTIVETVKITTTETVPKGITEIDSSTTETEELENGYSETAHVITHQDSDDVVVRNKENVTQETKLNNADSEGNILDGVEFPKVDIAKYRRNSSVNEDDIRLRRGNLEDFHTLANKRSKSLTNTADPVYVAYDMNLNESRSDKDLNGNDGPQKVICKLYDGTVRKQSVDNSISSTEKEFIEIDKATRELEREISKLNSALIEDEAILGAPRFSVSDIKRRFDNNNTSPPNPIPKPRRSHYGGHSPDHVV